MDHKALAALLFPNVTMTAQELEEKFGIPIIGTIPNFDSAGSKGGYNYGYRKSQKKGSK